MCDLLYSNQIQNVTDIVFTSQNMCGACALITKNVRWHMYLHLKTSVTLRVPIAKYEWPYM